MATSIEGKREDVWFGNVADADAGFNGGRMWIGKHSADGDTLVFDPEVSDPTATNVELFSLTHLRHKRFSREVVSAKIQEITDAAQHASAAEEYRRRIELKEEREKERTVARGAAVERRKQGALDRHREFLEERGIAYEGVRDTSTGKTPGAKRRRTKCHACGIALDDFASSECLVCGGVLCSCGACGCAAPVKER
jgi:hypothetical protein